MRGTSSGRQTAPVTIGPGRSLVTVTWSELPLPVLASSEPLRRYAAQGAQQGRGALIFIAAARRRRNFLFLNRYLTGPMGIIRLPPAVSLQGCQKILGAPLEQNFSGS
jgi:hypothetical protein